MYLCWNHMIWCACHISFSLFSVSNMRTHTRSCCIRCSQFVESGTHSPTLSDTLYSRNCALKHLTSFFTSHTHTHKPTHTHPFCYSIKSAKSILSGILNMTFATDYWQHRRLIEWHRTKTSISWFFEREKYVSQLFKEFNNFIWEKSALKEIRIKIKTYASMIIRLPP